MKINININNLELIEQEPVSVKRIIRANLEKIMGNMCLKSLKMKEFHMSYTTIDIEKKKVSFVIESKAEYINKKIKIEITLIKNE